MKNINFIEEFSDDNDNTYVVLDYGEYTEVLLVLANYDKKDGSVILG